ncbi:MAG: YopX family protein [Treponema sp.]|jgi:hypothetical protein|nr:YopX family protein [Treponema sp.]
MREIEFRGRNGTEGSWYYGDLKVKRGEPYIVPRYGRDICFKVEPETVGQYIGLKAADSIRRRIVNQRGEKDLRVFEGDIVLMRGIPWVVIRESLTFVLDPGNGNARLFINEGLFEKNPVKIIGVIHDNPELLEDIGGDSQKERKG